MTFQWPVAKLDLINRALAQCGDSLCNTADDGSDEWNTASPAYEDALAVLMEGYNWGFATKVATLTASPTPPADTQWDTAYVLPPDLIHIVWVRMSDTPDFGIPARYDILANQIVVNAQGGPPPPNPPIKPAYVTMKYVSMDNADPVNATPLFVRALTAFVVAGIYRGLHEDIASADRAIQQAEQFTQQAKTRYNQQKPKTQLWRSRISARRWGRLPWRGGWGGPEILS